MSDYLNIIDSSKCTGCMACYNICPKHAISMQEGEDTFMYPFVDKELCVECGLCEKACPLLKTTFHEKQNYCYAAIASPEIQSKSSSGGMFSLFAEYIIDQGGVVCGVQYDKNWNPEHVIVNSKKDLYKLRGSKYVQSSVGYVYKDIQKILASGQKVLFSGTPCQVAGLYGVLGKTDNLDNLLTIDIACHGVPSQKIWQAYLSECFDKKKIRNINFRDKEKGWKCAICDICAIVQDNTKTFHEKYMNGFVHNLYLRESCGNCQFAKSARVSDVTLADYWGIWKEDPSMYNHLGVSLVSPNSEKGKQIFQALQARLASVKRLKFETAKMNYPLFRSTVHHANRAFFLKKFKESNNFNKSIDASLKYVSIINFWWCNNYGAMCTAYALQEIVKDLGYIAKTVNYIPQWFYNLRYKGGISEAFAKEHFNLTKLVHSKKELEALNNECSSFICGSDQIWRYGVEQLRNWKYFKDYENLCFLSYAHNDKKKIAFSASFACDEYEGAHRNRQFVRYLLNRFQHISVRERDGVDICKNEFGVNATHVLDPVFLRDEKFWSDIAATAKLTAKDHICYYVLDTPDAKKHTLNYIKERVGGELIDISKGFNEPLENWLYHIKNCKLFVADSFHGCCLAIIFNKPFICFKNTFRGGSRFDSIFQLLGLENRILMDYEQIENREDLFDPINYTDVNKILELEKEKSLAWLKMALDDDSEIKTSASDDMIEAMFNLLEDTINSKNQLGSINLPSGVDSDNKSLLNAADGFRAIYISNHMLSCKARLALYRFKMLTHVGEKRQKYKEKYKKLKEAIKQAKRIIKHIKA